MNMQSIMAQAQKMQRDITKKKEQIDAMSFDGKSELVQITVNGKKEVLAVEIDKNTNLDKDDIEVLEDMIKIAMNDALSKIDADITEIVGPSLGTEEAESTEEATDDEEESDEEVSSL